MSGGPDRRTARPTAGVESGGPSSRPPEAKLGNTGHEALVVTPTAQCPGDGAGGQKDGKANRAAAQLKKGRGLSAQRLHPRLSSRDIALLKSLSSLRLATSQQLERLHFREGSTATQARRCRRALQRLVEQRLLGRLERRIGGVRAGSAGFIYCLAPKGYQVLNLLAGGTKGHYYRRPEPSRHLVEHTLAGSELYVQLVEASQQGRLELLHYQSEPDCWRSYLGSGGQSVIVRPDGLLVLCQPGADREHWWFIEVDLGTEAPATIRHKIRAYQSYAASGHEQAVEGVFPRVAFLTSSEKRAAVLQRAVNAVPDGQALCTVDLLDSPLSVLLPGQRANQHQDAAPKPTDLKGGQL